MKVLRGLGNLVGVGPERSLSPPRYQAVADGLIVTDRAAEAWYVLQASNTDLMSEPARDAEHDQAASALSRMLAKYECHLRILWAPISPDDYAIEARAMFTAGDGAAWADLRVERLRELALPGRHLLLGVRIADRSGPAASQFRAGAQAASGLASGQVPEREMARFDAAARRLLRSLEATPWRATLAGVDLLAWSIAREQHRGAPPPADGAGRVTGARLAQLTRGRVVPYPDHLRVMNADGGVAAWVSVLAMTAFPEEMQSPGAGEWLRVLSEITYAPDFVDGDFEDYDPGMWPVCPEASIRFKVMERREAHKLVDGARKLAKEQRQSAGRQSAGETSREIEETEDTMAELSRAMRRDDVTLVLDHPRLLVTSDVGLEDLRARVDATVAYYGGCGIEVVVGDEEQRDLWLEAQPGDRTRVMDLGHTRTVDALAGSWWWGGAQVGDEHGPVIGVLTGSTPGLVRHDLTAGSDRGDATTTAIIGRSGRGKTTLMMMEMLNAAFTGAMVLALDFKGDLGGLVTAGRHFGLPAHVVEPGMAHAGVLDLFRVLQVGPAQMEVTAQLHMLLPPHLRARGGETAIQSAVNAVSEMAEPATWRVVEELRNSDDELAHDCGAALGDLAATALGAPIMGRPAEGAALLEPAPGLWLIQVPGMSLPQAGTAREDWEVTHRLSYAMMQSLIAYAVVTAGRKDLRGLRKVVGVPEVHVLTATTQGRTFLQFIARVGRALRQDLVFDTQDPDTLAELHGLIEQITTLFAFQLTSESQQDALARMLDMPVDANTRSLLRAIGIGPGGEVRHGHCIMLDHRFRLATVQIDMPSAKVAAMLSTTPDVPDEPDGSAGARPVPAEATA